MNTWSQEDVVKAMKGFNVDTEAGLLVFCDWLEEQGQLDWANVCRLFRPSNASKFSYDIIPTVKWLNNCTVQRPKYYLDGWKRHGVEP